MVSILITAYNHEKYISQAIESVLMQQCDFDFEVLVNDDCSGDSTSQIIKEIEAANPQKVKGIYHSENQYSIGKKPWFHELFPRATGRYIALLDGDDYWEDPQKLQKQVEFLEKNKDYVACYHPVVTYVQKTGEFQNPKLTCAASFKDFDVLDEHVPTLSILFRNRLKNIPDRCNSVPHGDKLLWSLLSEHGTFYRFSEIMAVYREHGGGTWSGENDISQIKNKIRTRWLIFAEANYPKQRKIIVKQIIDHSRSGLSRSIKRDQDIFDSFTFAFNWIKAQIFFRLV